jgi:hypothetical protein
MKIQGRDFGDIPQAVCLPQQSAQVLSERPLAGMLDPPKARSLRSVFWTLITFGALESSQSSRQISGGIGLPQQRSVGYRPRSAPLQRVQAQIRHKRFPLRAAPIYSVLNLSSLPLRTERSPYFVFDYLLARSSLSKSKPNPANREKRKSRRKWLRFV